MIKTRVYWTNTSSSYKNKTLKVIIESSETVYTTNIFLLEVTLLVVILNKRKQKRIIFQINSRHDIFKTAPLLN